jgi:hypothetical protein
MPDTVRLACSCDRNDSNLHRYKRDPDACVSVGAKDPTRSREGDGNGIKGYTARWIQKHLHIQCIPFPFDG